LKAKSIEIFRIHVSRVWTSVLCSVRHDRADGRQRE
jgi:hypothetical protein